MTRRSATPEATGSSAPRWRQSWSRGWTYFFVLLGLVAAGSFWVDRFVVDAVRENLWPYNMSGPVWPVLAASMLGKYGDWPQLMGAGLFLYFIARRLQRRQLARVCLILMLGSTLAGATVNTLRLTTGRTRPSNQEVQGWVGPVYDGQLTIGRHAFNAFPSGHTATAFGFFGPLLFTPFWRSGLLLLPIPVAIGIARVLTLSHQPSDVLCSIWIALLLSALLVVGLERRRVARQNNSIQDEPFGPEPFDSNHQAS